MVHPLLLPQEILCLSPNKVLLMVEGHAPIMSQKLCWDNEGGLGEVEEQSHYSNLINYP